MQIEVGKKYRRRDGRVVEIASGPDKDGDFSIANPGAHEGRYYCPDGTFTGYGDDPERGEHIIEEYIEPAAPPTECKLVYIAGRYTGVTPDAVNLNCRAAEFMGRLARERGWYPVIPHMNTEAWDSEHKDTDADWYYENTLELLRRCDAVLMVPGWQESTGARGEHDEALRRGMPVWYDAYDLERVSHAA